MSSISSDDYSQSPVPEHATVSGWRIALTKLGVVVALPGFIAGAQIGFTYGVSRGLLAIALGGLVLTGIAIATSAVAVGTRLTASLLIQRTFGTVGSRLVNVILATVLLGWFGVTAQIFGASIAQIIAELYGLALSPWPFIISGGCLMMTTSLYGFSGLQKLADVTIPALLIVLLIAVWRSLDSVSLDAVLAVPKNAPPLGTAISAVIGSLVTGVVIFPDLARFARTRKGAALAAFLTFALGMPAVLMLAAIPSNATDEHDLIAMLTILGMGVPAFLILILKSWATNSSNLYSASLGLRTVFPTISRPRIVALGGLAGVIFALLGISNHFMPLLQVVGVGIPPLAGIYFADFMVAGNHTPDEPKPIEWMAFLSWGAGIAVASMTLNGLFHLSGVPALDSISTSFLAQFAQMRLVAGHRGPFFKGAHATD